MFGYLPAPCRCRIGDLADLYRSTFCGLCNALASQYGQPARLLVNRDSTFVALLAAAQAPETPMLTFSTRCQPWSRPMPVFENGSIPAFAGAVTFCGLQAKLDDERADERGLRAAGCRLLSALARPRFDRARAVLTASEFPLAEVWRQLAGQSCVEAHVARGGDPAEAAQPSARTFGAILAHTARLTGHGSNVAPLAQVGRSLGELVYTLDAYQDMDEDLRRGRFNFLAPQTGSRQTGTREQVRRRARAIAAQCQQEIRQAWQEVKLLRYRPVLEAVLLTGLSARTERVLATDAGRLLTAGDESQPDGAERGSAPHDVACWDRCGYCYCPGGDCSGCGECCGHGCGSNGCCCDGDCSGCDCGSGDCSGCDCGDCDCGNCDCGNCDCSGCDCNC